VLLAFALAATFVAVSGARRPAPPPRCFALLGVSAFVVMEHVERLGAGGSWPLTSRVFLLGLVLQLPFALAAWWVARTLLRLDPAALRPPPLLPRRLFALPRLPVLDPAAAPVRRYASPCARRTPVAASVSVTDQTTAVRPIAPVCQSTSWF
jgi:hypothetical protein